MSDSMLVRASRDGDQFHYLWAARRALRLLMPASDFVAMTIEGASTEEFQGSGAIEEGEELIDIAEYFGSTQIEHASCIKYIQLKHSTKRDDKTWTPSELEKTISGFAERYKALTEKFSVYDLGQKLEFWFVSNRPTNQSIDKAVKEIADHGKCQDQVVYQKLEKYTSLKGEDLTQFCKLLNFDGGQYGYWDQRNILTQDVACYLPNNDVNAPIRLKELVTKKALSESAGNPSITKMDILRELQTDIHGLFPAPSLAEILSQSISRHQEQGIIREIINTSGTPVVISADAGVGKTILSTRIGQALPSGSASILYDCFANGDYRNASGYRHHHKTALVQITNELSAQGLCHPLIPSSSADSSEYMRAFLYRVNQSITLLRAKNPDSLLCIVVDAADNAQMAAEELGEKRSFIKDLLRERFPEGVRIVALCRPYRQEMLALPPSTKLLRLDPFTLEESSEHLKQQFPEATEQDVSEFHRLSSNNPRVQALALSLKKTLPEILRHLGPHPTTVDSTINTILQRSVADLRHASTGTEQLQIDLICKGLAILRPMIPLSVLSQVAGVSHSAIRSFATELGRPLKVSDDRVQFSDEPTETWFRNTYRPDKYCVIDFISRLEPLAAQSAYVASVLPQLMLEAGQLPELIELALSSQGLPDTNPIERRDVELQRLQFAFKAALREKRYAEAAKLALKAGGESAGNNRQSHLLQNNIDLAAAFLDADKVQELVSREPFGTGWTGSHNAYDAAILSEHHGLIGEARSRLRMAEEWLRNWSTLSHEERNKESVSDEDRAVMATAEFNIHGPEAAADSLRRWTPRHLSYSAGRIIAHRLLDHGRYDDVDDFAIAAGNNLWLVLAIAVEAHTLHRSLPLPVVQRTLKLLSTGRIHLNSSTHPWRSEKVEPNLGAVTALLEIALKLGACSSLAAKDILAKFLPPSPPLALSDRFEHGRALYLRAYALHAALSGDVLQLTAITPDEFKENTSENRRHSYSREQEDFKRHVGGLIPWYNLWGKSLLGQLDRDHLEEDIAETKSASAKAEGHRDYEESFISNEIAGLWIDILLETESATEAAVHNIVGWSSTLHRQLFTPTLNRLSRLCVQTQGIESFAYHFSETAFALLKNERTDADIRADSYIDVARSLLNFDRHEAEYYFDQALDVVNKLGDENLYRWDAILNLANKAAGQSMFNPELAYQFARCAEVSWDYVVRDKHFAWHLTIEALAGLCPSSAIAISSRWQDRRFGIHRQVLSTALEKILADGHVSALGVFPFTGFRDGWNENALLAKAIPLLNRKEEKISLLESVYRSMSVEKHGSNKWKEFEQHAIAEGGGFPNIKEFIAASEEREKRGGYVQYSHSRCSEPDANENSKLDCVFFGCDLTSPEGILFAYERYRAGDPPYSIETFLRIAISKLRPGIQTAFIRAFGMVPRFGFFELEYLLKEIPPAWGRRQGIRSSVAMLLKDFCRKRCMEFTRSFYYTSIPFERAYELSGVDESGLTKEVLAGLAESAELVSSEKFFNSVGLISDQLSGEEALQVLSFGLGLFDPVLEDSDGDGPWGNDLLPPEDIEESLAGYLWVQLGSPVVKIRWEAAHVVVALCRFKRTVLLDKLIGHAQANTDTPFIDKRFTFYRLTAQQWLLFATSRAALEYGDALVPHIKYFQSILRKDPPHLFIRMLASRTLRNLHTAKKVQLSVDDLLQASRVTESPFEQLSRQHAKEQVLSRSNLDTGLKESNDEDRFFFGIDFGPYWFAPLGRCFGLNEQEVEAKALNVLRHDLEWAGAGRRDDERASQNLFRYEDTSHSHGSYPNIEELHFYLCYHTMMITAGKLLASMPLVEHDSDPEHDYFSDWIDSHDITRPDGRWLSDRRDPEPFDRLNWEQDFSDDEWLLSIATDEFEHILYNEDSLLPVWGQWTEVHTHKSLAKDISVSSALVSKERSSSLLVALQTTQDPYDYKIPDAGDNSEIDSDSYQLKGWIHTQYRDMGVDRKDPWSGSSYYPAPEPASFTIESMSLSPDEDRRLWSATNYMKPVLNSLVWGSFDEDDKNGSEVSKGSVLKADIQFLKKFLAEIDMDLIAEIQITKRRPYGSHTWQDNDDLQRIPPSAKIFIIKSDGSISSL